MLQFFPVLVFGFAASLGLTPLSRQIAMRLGVVDKPNQRKIHHDHKPLMGGLAIYTAFALSLLIFSPPRHFVELGAILAGAAFVALIGLLDDRYNLGIRVRLAATAIAAGVVVLSGITFGFTPYPLVNGTLTIFWIMAITNAVNFLDNMDGLAAGLSAIAAFFFMFAALTLEASLVSLLAAGLLGSAVGFLTYNFAPSSTFMGDMGALMLGFVLAVTGVKLEVVEGGFSAAWLVPVLVLALPAFDINLVIFTRLAEGRSPGEAGKDHTSHRLMALGLSQRQTLLVLYGACALYGSAALVIVSFPGVVAWLTATLVALSVAALYAWMIHIRRRYQLAPKPATTT